jgi:serine/threonine protein kinase
MEWQGDDLVPSSGNVVRETEIFEKSDVWAFGCIFCELCTAVRAFESDYAVQVYQAGSKAPMFGKRTSQRVPVMDEFAARLDSW